MCADFPTQTFDLVPSGRDLLIQERESVTHNYPVDRTTRGDLPRPEANRHDRITERHRRQSYQIWSDRKDG